MNKRTKAANLRGLLLSLFVLGLAITLIVLPYGSEAKKAKWRTESAEPGVENYDIRTAKSEEATQFLAAEAMNPGGRKG